MGRDLAERKISAAGRFIRLKTDLYDETDLTTGKGKNNDEIQGSFTSFRMTTKATTE
jgi:hypothetical protein